jgi:predicted lactoylglutathione lyase
MAFGGPNHLDLCVKNITSSISFYDTLLSGLGYVRGAVSEKTQTAMKTPLIAYMNADARFSITLRPAKLDHPYQRDAIGFHHLALSAVTKEQVDQVYDAMKHADVTVADPPAFYPDYVFMKEYYAVYFTDPDNLKIEVVYMRPHEAA